MTGAFPQEIIQADSKVDKQVQGNAALSAGSFYLLPAAMVQNSTPYFTA